MNRPNTPVAIRPFNQAILFAQNRIVPTTTVNMGDLDGSTAIEHAERIWLAECENAERYAKRVQVLTVLATTFTGVALYKAAEQIIGSHVLVGNVWPLRIAIVISFFLVWKQVRNPVVKALVWTGAKTESWHLVFVAIVLVGLAAYYSVYGNIVGTILGFAAILCFVSSFAYLLRALLVPDDSAEFIDSTTASRFLDLDYELVKSIRAEMGILEGQILASLLFAGVNLRNANSRLKLVIGSSERYLAAGIVCSVMTIVIFSVTPPRDGGRINGTDSRVVQVENNYGIKNSGNPGGPPDSQYQGEKGKHKPKAQSSSERDGSASRGSANKGEGAKIIRW